MTSTRAGLKFVAYRPSTWDEIVRLGRFHGGFIFRGVGDSRWGFQTSLERTAIRYGTPSNDLPSLEKKLIERFQRAAHLYFPPTILPTPVDWLGWMSVIQHYGGPTRLLDFTESFYCAAFFALETAERRAAIWAVNRRELESKVVTQVGVETKGKRTLTIRRSLRSKLNESITRRTSKRLVFPFFPERLHERLAQQQGLFLACGRVDVPFQTQLCEALDVDEGEIPEPQEVRPEVPPTADLDELSKLNLVKIEIEKSQHRKARAELKRMNLTTQSIYPGPDGYARALHWELGWRQEGEADFLPTNPGRASDLTKPSKRREPK